MTARHLVFALLLGVLAGPGRPEASAQPVSNVVSLRHWPASLYEAPDEAGDETWHPYDLMPSVDSLALGYAYGIVDDRPVLHAALAWTPGPVGVLDDVLVPYDDLPGDIRIVAVHLSADVVVEGQHVGDLVVRIDSLALPPLPDLHEVVLDTLSWASLFTGVPADEARRYVQTGFTLHNLDILRIAFASYEPAAEDDGAVFDPRYPRGVGVYPPDVIIWVDWLYGGRRRVAGKGGDPRTQPRDTPREGIGRTVPAEDDRPRRRGDDEQEAGDRTDRTRTGDRERAEADRREGRRTLPAGKKDDDDDDDDDDEQLLPVALAGVAAVGILAVAGGTVGYYGNSIAPIGLTAGMVRPEGGILLQVAVNEGVLGDGDVAERLLGKALFFYDAFQAPVQPSFSVGVLAEEDGDDISVLPSLAVGAVGTAGPVVFFGGYDFQARSVDFGVAFNFRYRRDRPAVADRR